VLAQRGRSVELAEIELVKLFQRVRHRHAGNEEVSSPPADGSAAANLPTRSDEELMAVKVSLVQVGTHLRSMAVKRQANRQHSPVAL
jgi:hypothetical protein